MNLTKGVMNVTRNKKAITVYVDKETDERIYDLRTREEFRYSSKSDIIRALIRLGLQEKTSIMSKEHTA